MDDEHAEATVVRADADDADSANQFHDSNMWVDFKNLHVKFS